MTARTRTGKSGRDMPALDLAALEAAWRLAGRPMIFATARDTMGERFRLAAELEALARSTGDDRFARAAGMLRGRAGGRRPVAPERLDDVIAALDSGEARSVRQACDLVAQTMSLVPHEIDRHAERLRKQYLRARARGELPPQRILGTDS